MVGARHKDGHMKLINKLSQDVKTMTEEAEAFFNNNVDAVGWDGVFALIKLVAHRRQESVVELTFEAAQRFVKGKL